MATGDILSVVIRDTASLVDGANTVNGNGWTFDTVYEGLSAGGITPDQSATFYISGSGFNSAGAPVLSSRTFKSRIALRRPWPNHTSHFQAVTGGNAIVTATLSENIYKDEVVTADFLAGSYTGANGLSGISVVNSSSFLYPAPQVAVITPPWQVARTNTFRVELYVTHPYGRENKMVQCVQFTVGDGINSVTSTITSMTSSTLLTGGNPVPCFAADMDITTLSNTLCSATWVVYPFYGTRIYSSLIDGEEVAGWSSATTQSHNPPKRLPFRKDITLSYAPRFADVSILSGNDTSGTTYTDPNNITHPSPYLTIAAAGSAIQVYNNSVSARNNAGAGVIRVKTGDYTTVFNATMTNVAKGDVWTEITRHPDCAPGSARLLATTTASDARKTAPKRTKMTGLTLVGVASGDGNVVLYSGEATTFGQFVNELWLDSCTLSAFPATSEICKHVGLQWYTNCIVISGGVPWGNGNNYRSCTTLLGGCTISGNTSPRSTSWMGNNLQSITFTKITTQSISAVVAPMFVANKFMVAKLTISNFTGGTSGLSWVNNVMERVTGSGGIKPIEMSADGITIPVGNVHCFYNTHTAGGLNYLYNDDTCTVAVDKWGYLKYNLLDDYNSKQDCNVTPLSGIRTGNWRVTHQVETIGNCCYNALSGAGGPIGPFARCGELVGFNCILSGGHSDFVSDRSNIGTDAGNGDYHILGTSNAIGRVQQGFSMLPFDVSGAPRVHPDCAGAYTYSYSLGYTNSFF